MEMKMRKTVRDIFILTWFKSYPDFRRNPFVILLLGTLGGIPLFFMSVMGGEKTFVHGLVGSIVSSVAFGGVLGPIQGLSSDRYVKMREMIVAMPVHPLSYALGTAAEFLLLSFPSVILFFGIAAYLRLLTPTVVVWMTLTLLIAWGAMSTTGFMISTYLSRASNTVLSSFANLLGFGFVFIPPVFYSESLLGSFSWVSVLIPTSNAAGLIRAYMGLLEISAEGTFVRVIVLILTLATAMVLTSRKARWRET